MIVGVGDEGARQLAHAIGAGCYLQDVTLGCCIGRAGVGALCTALATDACRLEGLALGGGARDTA